MPGPDEWLILLLATEKHCKGMLKLQATQYEAGPYSSGVRGGTITRPMATPTMMAGFHITSYTRTLGLADFPLGHRHGLVGTKLGGSNLRMDDQIFKHSTTHGRTWRGWAGPVSSRAGWERSGAGEERPSRAERDSVELGVG